MEWLWLVVLLAVYVGIAYVVRRLRPASSKTEASPPQSSMTPDEFRRDVLPLVLDAWHRRCFCHSTAFTRMVATELGPNALADAQILIHNLIEAHFLPRGPWTTDHGEQSRPFSCPQCGANCVVFWEDFSINMDRAYVQWLSGPAPRGARTPYLIGFYGFSPPTRVDGFHRVHSPEEFITELVGGAS